MDLVGDQQITDKSLDQIGREHNTDKAGDRHNYLRHYQELFGARQGEPITLLELGVQSGASLKMWSEYFYHPDTKVVGVDNDPNIPRYFSTRLITRIGDQADADFLTAMSEEFGGFDIVIDDASHNGDASRASFEILYPHVRLGGFYIVEDLHTAYFGWGSSFVDYTTQNLLERVVWPGGRAFSHGHGDPRNHEQWPRIRAGMDKFSRQTRSITFLSSLIVFEKWPAWESFE